MSTPSNQQQNNSQIKDPKEWKSGDDPATPSQVSYLETLAEQAGKEPPCCRRPDKV